jgi:hypothetical protein
MINLHEVIDHALQEILKAKAQVQKIKTAQVRAAPDKDYLKAVAYSWFRAHRVSLVSIVSNPDLSKIDSSYNNILTASDKNASRNTYLDSFRLIKSCLLSLRTSLVVSPSTAVFIDVCPDFSGLTSDGKMIRILTRRWDECQNCMKGGAHLAASVMMGGLLEALFVAKANRLSDKSPLFKAKTTPIDAKTKKPLDLKEWTLRPYIDVGHELGWITKSGKDVAAVLRDYRNYIHPEKERSHGIELGEHDSKMFWEVTKVLTKQLLM